MHENVIQLRHTDRVILPGPAGRLTPNSLSKMNLPETPTESSLLRHSNGYLAACAIGIVFCWMQSLAYLNHVVPLSALDTPLPAAQGASSVRAGPGTSEIQRTPQMHGPHDRQRIRSAAYSCKCMMETGCADAATAVALPSLLLGNFSENTGAESRPAELHPVTFSARIAGQRQF